jgi:Pyruvate/2-oxoacid:ferredoxin oxidoreductase gamma subunit
MGSQFAVSTALSGRDFATFPDYPAEIRAPAGTTFGVSAYQINLGGEPITTAGDAPDVLVAFNPAALKVSLPMLQPGALIVLNNDSFTPRNLTKAGYDDDPRDGNTLDQFQVVTADIGHLNLEAVRSFGLSKSEGGRCKNFWTLGLLLWMFGRQLEPIETWIRRRLAGKPTMRDANIAALHAGHAFGETAELSASLPQLSVETARMTPGEYRSVTGAEALALGIAASGELADRPVLFCSYPITPSSPLLHRLTRLQELGVGTFQAEDEIAAICAAIGASYGGMIGVTSSSGPGIALKTEAMGLAVSAELPLLIVNWQRGRADAGAGGCDFGRMLRHGCRSCAHGRAPHDAGDPARRRLSVERVGTLADTCRRIAAADREPPGARGVTGFGCHSACVPARCGQPWPTLDNARHAGPRASHGWPRKGLCFRAHFLRPRQPSAHDGVPPGKNRCRRRLHSGSACRAR